jgi:hypothetical protein
MILSSFTDKPHVLGRSSVCPFSNGALFLREEKSGQFCGKLNQRRAVNGLINCAQ